MVGGFGFRILNPSDYKRYYDGYCICNLGSFGSLGIRVEGFSAPGA